MPRKLTVLAERKIRFLEKVANNESPALPGRQRCRVQRLRALFLGLGFRSWGSGFRVQVSGFRVQGSGFRVQVAGSRVQGSGQRVQSESASTTGREKWCRP